MADIVVEQHEEIMQLRETLARAAAEIVRLRADRVALLDECDRLGMALAKARAALRTLAAQGSATAMAALQKEVP